jgi:hypothetical protein
VADSEGFAVKVRNVLAEPSLLPAPFAAWVRSQIARNPVVQLDHSQLPVADRKHYIGTPQGMPFENSWANYGGVYEPASYFKDMSGVISLQGMIALGVVGSAVWTLPPSYRPVHQITFTVLSNGALGRLDVMASGDVVPGTGCSNVWVSLSGLSYRI